MKKILIVDDSEFYLEIAKDLLEHKYQITVAKSGNEALTHLSKGFIPNLILLDIIMPELDGWEAFNLIKGISLLAEVPIVFFTSLDSDIDLTRAFSLGAADIITKPFDNNDFANRIDSIIERRSVSG